MVYMMSNVKCLMSNPHLISTYVRHTRLEFKSTLLVTIIVPHYERSRGLAATMKFKRRSEDSG